MLAQAEMRHAGLVELKKYERGQLELAIQRRERALADKGKKIQALSKWQAKLRAQRNKVAPKAGKARSNRYLTNLARLREVDTELEFCRNWVAQKERVLTAKRGKLSSPLKAIDEGRYSLCFGSKKLLQQRPGEHNTEPTVDDRHEAWDTARNGQVWSIGHTAKPSGNRELQWLPDTNQLRVLRMSPPLWLGRQALYGIPWKTVGAQCFVKRHNERLVFSHLPATPKQSKTALAGAQWKDVARALGKNRQRWG